MRLHGKGVIFAANKEKQMDKLGLMAI